MGTHVQYSTLPLAQLLPWERNPRRIDKDALRGLDASVERFGLVQPIVFNQRSGRVVGGHQRLKVLRARGVTDVPVAIVDLSDDDEKALNIALNNPHIAGEFTDDLQTLLGELRDSDADLMRLLRLDLLEDDVVLPELPDSLIEADPDDVPALSPEAVSRKGDVWQLGRHRLLVGDSDQDDWAPLLLLPKERVHMVWTDPPYGVSYESAAGRIENDDLPPDELSALLSRVFAKVLAVTVPGAPWYVAAPGGPLFHAFSGPLLAMGIWRQTITWVKDQFVLGRSDFHYRHEPLFYGWSPGGKHTFCGARTLDTVWEVPRPRHSDLHPTMKPVELVARSMRYSSDAGAVVLDVFGGSGTTLIAAEAEGRTARLVEFSPVYADRIVRRWMQLTKSGAVDAEGRSFAERESQLGHSKLGARA